MSYILDMLHSVHYIGQVTLSSVGRLIADRRRARGLSLRELAAMANVGRSTLAALESGQLAELGYAKVARICEVLDLTLEARPLMLEAPLMPHRHLTETAGRELTRAAIEDVVVHGTFAAWRGLVKAIRSGGSPALNRRVREVVAALDAGDPKVRTFALLLPELLPRAEAANPRNG